MTRLGFNTRVSFTDSDGPAQGLRDGIELFKTAEVLGYQSGWVYQRHFDHYLSSPLPFLTAVGQHTSRITLGTAVLPMRYQEPILLAEAAATADLLVDGRLELAVATGTNAAFDALFGAVDTDTRTEAERRQTRFLAAVGGETLHLVDGPGQGAPVGTEIKVTPHSPGLVDRIRQGASSIGSARRAAELGIGLIVGTVLHDLAEGETFSAYQARIITAYRTTWREKHTTEPPRVAVAASILPGTTPELRDTYAAYDHQRRTQGMAASRPDGALTPVITADLPAGMRISPVFHGTPDQVITAVQADPGLTQADDLVLFLPPAFTLPQNTRLLADLAATVAPSLGWTRP
ncbi:LLM class flavin-dependent oxidoreductase [Actinokineospora diospyrosa]|uniref:Flavin-dependent oxidoreductase, luciferase family (Includes alkanesulfonate monooxygenase SsuD and methylene tetrahydromethanopterin reductase) n=1 Tax=Actinokineospora diospyrosa TaxID=103728 RepID=A0ABT1IMH4_9PSEU|nr:LLM class flavin-dependent oxidoreductase [Actinokineospora diospyrosa]MCP2273862.1 Flavin-dependent oxidoreductase, luciferase family (includes alkanesulfonate monooxygenase SsuD and methylene tetrahydromethanopterin reductase) [Actinokineospora diospyrosa]